MLLKMPDTKPRVATNVTAVSKSATMFRSTIERMERKPVCRSGSIRHRYPFSGVYLRVPLPIAQEVSSILQIYTDPIRSSL